MASEIMNEEKMDKALSAMSRKITRSEALYINSRGIAPFEIGLRENIKNRKVPYRNPDYVPDRKAMLDTLVENTKPDGGVEIGFSKKGKKAYLARFMNDGWDVKNQFGGPYTHVEGEHFWEHTEEDFKKSVEASERSALLEVMHKRGLPR